MQRPTERIIYWAPRILTIGLIILLALFAIDVFDEGLGIVDLLISFFMHLIPSFIVLGLLIVAWKWEKIGAIFFLALGVIFTIFFNTYKNPISFMIVSFPLLVIGILFYMNKFIEKY